MTAPTQPAEQTPQQARAQLTAAQLAAIVALAQAQAKLRQQLTQTAITAALAPFRAFTGWWDAAAVNRAIDQVLRVVQPTQRQMAQVTDAYLARVVSEMTGRTVRPVGTVDVTRLRRQITEQVARELVDGTRQPAFVVLGEFDPATGRVDRAETINEPVQLAIPEPGQTAARTTTSSTRSQAEQLRAQAREQAQALIAATRRSTRTATTAPPAAQSTTGSSAARTLAEQRTTPAATTTRSVDADDVVDPAMPYGRIADQYRYQVVAEGVPEEKARQRALVRIEAVAQTDVTLAVREQVRRTLGRIRGIEGYRRIVRPELSETGPCGLCVVAADRIYRVEDLHPIHDRCVCDVLPIIGDLDPGLVLNSDDLGAIYDEAGGTGGEVLKRGRRHSARLKSIRVALAEHGELGPVLVDADQHHRGPVDVARTRHPDRQVRQQAQLAAFEERLGTLLARQGRGEDGLDRAIEWQTERVDRLRRDLGDAAPARPAARPATTRRRVPARAS